MAQFLRRFSQCAAWRGAGVEAEATGIVPFEFSRNEILNEFYEWCKLRTPFVFKRKVSIRRVYLPFWCFNFTVKSTCNGFTQVTEYSAMKERASDPDNDRSVCMIYAGCTYRRNMLNVVKCDLKSSLPVQSFSVPSDVTLDEVWLPREVAWKRVQEQGTEADSTRIQQLYLQKNLPFSSINSECQMNSARLLYLPCYVCVFRRFFKDFRVFFSGYDGDGFGLPHLGFARETAQRFDEIIQPHQRSFFTLLFKAPFVLLFAALNSISAPLSTARFQRKSFEEWKAIQREDLLLFPPKAASTPDPAAASAAGPSKSHSIRRRNVVIPGAVRRRPLESAEPLGELAEESKILDPLKNYYEILGVKRKASSEDIKLAFHSVIQKYHPDSCQQRGIPPEVADDVSKRLIKAYSVLKDPTKRKDYDKWL